VKTTAETVADSIVTVGVAENLVYNASTGRSSIKIVPVAPMAGAAPLIRSNYKVDREEVVSNASRKKLNEYYPYTLYKRIKSKNAFEAILTRDLF
jgi:hypothetical protein